MHALGLLITLMLLNTSLTKDTPALHSSLVPRVTASEPPEPPDPPDRSLLHNLIMTQTTAPSTRPLAATRSPQLLNRKLRTDAPMLNYIFDSYSSKGKHHHGTKWDPHFEDSDVHHNGSILTVQVGGSARMNCSVVYLRDKTVSWVRRRAKGMELLTVGNTTYSADSRYQVDYRYPSNYKLVIRLVNKRDEGLYECQIPTHPPKVIQTHLYVNDPEVVIVDEKGTPLSDKYYEANSTIQLSCIVRHVAMTSSVVLWHHGNRILNYDTTRGGISVKTELTNEGANSTLFVARVNSTDSGNYSCSIATKEQATVTVHVLNESLAELHHGSRGSIWNLHKLLLYSVSIMMILR